MKLIAPAGHLYQQALGEGCVRKLPRAIYRVSIAIVCFAVALSFQACRKADQARFSGSSAKTSLVMDDFVAGVTPTQRYIAEHHKIEIFTSESKLQKSWESAVAFCGTIQCEVVSSSITARTGDSLPSGTMSLRVSPKDLNKLLACVEKLGKVGEHTTEREDKTVTVVDTQARIKNLTAFRDNLRAMLTRPSATVKDLVEIQKQLTDTQSELDGETAQRKILANETEKIAVQISFLAETSAGGVSGLAEIWNTVRQSGDILADSTASLITTIVAVVPWLILLIPVIWLLAKGWRALRRRLRNAAS